MDLNVPGWPALPVNDEGADDVIVGVLPCLEEQPVAAFACGSRGAK
jgi:hypothetical protein